MTKALNQKESADWHPADIVAALKKAGWTISELSRHQGYSSPGTLRRAIERKWPKGEEIIAEAIGLPPQKQAFPVQSEKLYRV